MGSGTRSIGKGGPATSGLGYESNLLRADAMKETPGGLDLGGSFRESMLHDV